VDGLKDIHLMFEERLVQMQQENAEKEKYFK
jgi:hypothetical protein